jgi:hypothetical protein
MTISSTTVATRTSTNGTAHTFSFGHPFLDPDDLTVYLVTTSDWSIALQTKDTHYTVSNNGNEAEVGGTITFINELQVPTAPATGKVCVILRYPDAIQDYNPGSTFEASNGETALDRIYQMLQLLIYRSDRSIRINDAYADATVEIPDLATRASRALGFDADGNVTVYDPSTIAIDAHTHVATDITGTAAILAGQSGGQTLNGGTAASETLVLHSTAHATKGTIRLGDATTGLFFDETTGRLSLGQDEHTMTVNGVVYGGQIMPHTESATEVGLGAHVHTNTAAWGAVIHGARTRGTDDAEAAVQANDLLMMLAAIGHDGTDYALSSQILFEVDGTPGNDDMPGRIKFLTAPDGSQTPAERVRIDANGVVTFSGREGAVTPTFNDSPIQVHVGSVTDAAMASLYWANDTTGPKGTFFKSRGATPNTYTVVQSGDILGGVEFFGADGTDFAEGGRIQAEVDGTPGADDMPGRIIVRTTPDGSQTSVERMRIDRIGNMTLWGSETAGSSATFSDTPIQAHCGSVSTAAAAFMYWFNDAFGPVASFIKSRGSGVNSWTVVQADDILGEINFSGADGTDSARAVRIRASVDGTPGADDMPGRLAFFTSPDGSQTAAERMRITSVGNVKIAGTANRGTTEGAGHLSLFDGTAPAGTLTNGVSLYSESGALKVMDSAGNAATLSGASPIQQGKHTIWVPAGAMTPGSGPPSSTTLSLTSQTFSVLAFDASSFESAFFTVAMPKSWDEGTITAQVYWAHPATATNFGVVWQIAGQAVSNDDTLDFAGPTAVNIAADTGGTTSDLYITAESSALTLSGSPAENDLACLRIGREATDGSDTLAVDAYLIGVKIFYTINAATDA